MNDSTITVLLLGLIAILYLLPTLIAFGREHPSRQNIAALNVLLGWTLVVWVGVFLWALLVEGESEPV